MQVDILKINILVSDLTTLVDNFKSKTSSANLSKELVYALDSFSLVSSKLSNSVQSDDIELYAKSVDFIALYGRIIGDLAQRSEISSYQVAGERILEYANNIRQALENAPGTLRSPANHENAFAHPHLFTSGNDYYESIKSIHEEQEKHDQRIKKLFNENELRVIGLEQKLKELEGVAQVEIDKITSTYLVSLNEVEGKKTEIDDILGHVSGRAVAGDYEKSAAEERKMADWLRSGSLVCMGAIAIVLGYSFIETIDTDFNWQKSLFRIALAFLLSVPAAYLARESAKHREQQYQHLQTSLDLKAISPFMASLPEDEQHKIKIAIASKIFAGRDFSKVSADPYPLNTHEIIIELIKRFDPAKANSKPTNDAAEPK